eukprot:3933115-Rhodomonas_salina.2
MPGPDIGATTVSLRTRYAMSRSDIGYRASAFGISGSEMAYGGTRALGSALNQSQVVSLPLHHDD